MTKRQQVVSLALDAYAAATESGDPVQRAYWRGKILALVEMTDLLLEKTP